MLLWQLFLAFFRVGLFSVGGGYVLIPLIEREVVTNFGWLSKEEFLHILGVTQGVPGAISLKFATYTGHRLAGPVGVTVANLGVILPPVLIMLGISGLLFRYGENPQVKVFLRAVKFATVGLLLSVVLEMARGLSWEMRGSMITAASVLLLSLFKLHPGLVIFLAGVLGIFIMR